MKGIIETAFIYIGITLLIYLGGSFIHGSFFVKEWHIATRGVSVFIWGALLFCITGYRMDMKKLKYVDKKDIKNP